MSTLRQFIYMLVWSSFIFIASSSCSVNILQEFGESTTNEAYLEEAKVKIDLGLYQDAIDLFDLMTTEFLAERDVVVLHASAYAGLCGVNFLNFVNAIANMGATNLLPTLLNTMKAATATEYAACDAAEDLILAGLPVVTSRTDDENLFAAVVSLAKMGAILAEDSALDSDNNGTVQAAWSGCTAPPAGTGSPLAVAKLQEFGFSTVTAISALSNQSVITGTFPSTVTTAIDALGIDAPSDVEAVTAQPLFRGMIREDSDNIGFNLNSVVTCAGPAPDNSANCACP